MKRIILLLVGIVGLAGIASAAMNLGTDYRVGGHIIRGTNCLYVIGGGNVGGAAQIVRIALDADGLPTTKASVGRICDGGCGSCVGAIVGRWLFVTGGDLKGVTVRFDIAADGTLANRTEFPDGDRPKCTCSGLVASGRYLVVLGGWQTRQVFAAEVKSDGTLGAWEKMRPLPTICFCEARAFTLGSRIYAAGNATYKGATDRVFMCETENDGKPGKWRRWAELPEIAAEFRFERLPNGKGCFYVNLETGHAYAAPIAADGEIGVWQKCSGTLPTEPFVSLTGTLLMGRRYLRYSLLTQEPREFKPADIINL